MKNPPNNIKECWRQTSRCRRVMCNMVGVAWVKKIHFGIRRQNETQSLIKLNQEDTTKTRLHQPTDRPTAAHLFHLTFSYHLIRLKIVTTETEPIESELFKNMVCVIADHAPHPQRLLDPLPLVMRRRACAVWAIVVVLHLKLSRRPPTASTKQVECGFDGDRCKTIVDGDQWKMIFRPAFNQSTKLWCLNSKIGRLGRAYLVESSQLVSLWLKQQNVCKVAQEDELSDTKSRLPVFGLVIMSEWWWWWWWWNMLLAAISRWIWRVHWQIGCLHQYALSWGNAWSAFGWFQCVTSFTNIIEDKNPSLSFPCLFLRRRNWGESSWPSWPTTLLTFWGRLIGNCPASSAAR